MKYKKYIKKRLLVRREGFERSGEKRKIKEGRHEKSWGP